MNVSSKTFALAIAPRLACNPGDDASPQTSSVAVAASVPANPGVASLEAPSWNLVDGIKDTWGRFSFWATHLIPEAKPLALPQNPVATPANDHGANSPAELPHRATYVQLDPAAVDTTSATAVNNFCWHAAKQLLGRKPKMSEVAWWRDQVMSQHKSMGDVQAMIANMPEGQMNATALASLGRNLTDAERAIYDHERQVGGKSLDAVLQDIRNLEVELNLSNSGSMGEYAARHRERTKISQAAEAVAGRSLSAAEQTMLADELRGKGSMADVQSTLADIAAKGAAENVDAMEDPGDEPLVQPYHQTAF